MAAKMVARSLVALLTLTGPSDAFWGMSCSVIQEGRIDPIVSPGKVATHAHKLAGASNIGLSSTPESLQASDCTSCEIQADKSAYYTPILYYEHSNGSFEEVPSPGMEVYYLGRGDMTADIKPFPAGLRMVSGDPVARSSDTSAKTYNNLRPTADRVSFACLGAEPKPESPGMSDTSCANGLRAQVQFQSCWNGVDLYKPDNSHVAYMSDKGLCPPGYPVHFMNIYLEVMYSVADIKQDGGRFVFSNGDPTGFGFYGNFINGWDTNVLSSAIKSCGKNNLNSPGGVGACPMFASEIQGHAQNCPQQPSLIDEAVSGMIEKLPGGVTVSGCPHETAEGSVPSGAGGKHSVLPIIHDAQAALPGIYDALRKRAVHGDADIVQGSIIGTVIKTAIGTVGTAVGTAVSGTKSHTANRTHTASHKHIKHTGVSSGFITSKLASASASAIVLTAVAPSGIAHPVPDTTSTAAVVNPINGYVTVGCYKAPTVGGLALTGAHFTDIESMTIQSCTAYCSKRGLGVAGIENGQGCYCGTKNLGVKVPTSSCNLRCPGDAAQICGGASSLSVYESG